MDFNPCDDQLLASGHENGLIYVWDLFEKKQFKSLNVCNSPVNKLKYDPSDIKFLYCFCKQAEAFYKVDMNSMQVLLHISQP